MAKTGFRLGDRTLAGPGLDEMRRLLTNSGVDPQLIAQMAANRPGVASTFDPQVFQDAARIAAANLDRNAAERRAQMEAQLQREQLAQQTAMQSARLNLDARRANADFAIQNRAQAFREQSERRDNDFRNRSLNLNDARDRQEFELRRQGQQFSQGMSLEELELRRRAAAQAEQQFREEMRLRQEGQQFSQGMSLADLELRSRSAGQTERQFREEMDLRRQSQQFQQGLSRDEIGLRKRAADLSELTSREEMRLRQQAFGIDQRRMNLAERQEGKQFSDAQKTDVEWRQLAASEIERDSTEMLKAARQLQLTPEGRRLFAKLSDERRAIAAAKGEMTPDQYAEMMGQWMNRFQEADLAGFEQQMPSIDEQITQRYRVMPNGMSAWMQPGKDGNWDLKLLDGYSKGQSAIDAAAMKSGNGADAVADVATRWTELYGGAKNAQKFAKDYAEAEKRLQMQWQNREENFDNPNVPQMPQQDVLREMRRLLEIQVASESGELQAPPGVANPQTPTNMNAVDGMTGPAQIIQQPTQTPGVPEPPPAAPAAAEQSQQPTAGIQGDEEYFATNPEASQIRLLYDQAMQAGDKAPPAFRELADAIATTGKTRHPAAYLSPLAISMLESSGSKDPMGDAAKSVASAIRTGSRHFSLMMPHEQEAVKTLPIIDPTNEDAIKQLPPGQYYLDASLLLHRVPPNTDPIYIKAAKAMAGPKLTPEQASEIARRELESITTSAGTRQSTPTLFPY